MTNKPGLLLICSFLFIANISNTQEINVVLKNVIRLDTENRLNIISDVNGDTCNSLIINTGWKGLKFYSNLGVERIIITREGYYVWIPNQAKSIKFIIPGFQLFEYELPATPYKYVMYTLEIIAKKGESYVLQDTLKPRLSFLTNPSNAKVFVNNEYKGRSPLLITDPEFTEFKYVIKKKGYSSFISTDSIDRQVKSIYAGLNNLYRSKRYFLLLNIKKDINVFPPAGEFSPFYGFLFGVFGETGYYSSLNWFYSADDAIFESHPYTSRKISFEAGITKQLGRSVFIYSGPGYTYRVFYEFNGDGFDDGTTNSVDLNAGFVFRIGWNYLLQLDAEKSLNHSYFSLGIGVGINLAKQKRSR